MPCENQYDIFTAIWDQHIMDHIVKNTNRYAEDEVIILGKVKPCLLLYYNIMMKGVDKKDQMLAI
ncbi:uncharacterized protein LOC126979533 [Leptidea sinapis]|uniref:uncharacterized protein LOC126979533 n=1 Tax=Leptidea sinapis TaxID=189913 RepID=UPI0021C48EAD|nr:uncharacterized protein LOC126979533 [Leptidea sinapis]